MPCADTAHDARDTVVRTGRGDVPPWAGTYPRITQLVTGSPVHDVDWDHFAANAHDASPHRRYLTQVAIELRLSAVQVIDTARRYLCWTTTITDSPDVDPEGRSDAEAGQAAVLAMRPPAAVHASAGCALCPTGLVRQLPSHGQLWIAEE